MKTRRDPLTGAVKYWELSSPEFLPAEIIFDDFGGDYRDFTWYEGYITISCTPPSAEVKNDGRRVSFSAYQSGQRFGKFAFSAFRPIEFALGTDKGTADGPGNILFKSPDNSWINPDRLLSVMVETKTSAKWSAKMGYRMRLTNQDLVQVRKFKNSYCSSSDSQLTPDAP